MTNPNPLTKVTVLLSESAFTALEFASVLTGDSRTDTVGRALLTYQQLTQAATSGRGSFSFNLTDAGPRARVEVNRPRWRFW